MESVTIGYIISGLLIGLAFGYILQRGRFCMNTAFRDIIFMNDLTLFRGYLIALVIMIIGGNLLNDLGLIHLPVQKFRPLANIVGGYVFGLGMVLAGGCGSGIWYRAGEGQFASVVGIVGFFMGIGATSNGLFKPVYNALRGVELPIAGKANITLWELFGSTMTVKWIVIIAIFVGISIFILNGKPFNVSKQKGYYWSVAGLLIGLTGVVAFWASEFWGAAGAKLPMARGLNFTTPTGELFFAILTGDARAPWYFPMFTLGHLKVTWPLFFILAVPFGSYLSARGLKEFQWKAPPVGEMLTVFGGSFLMGFGATVGGGCNIGQALTGVSSLSVGSIVASIFIVLGNWTMVYFKFIKPMQD